MYIRRLIFGEGLMMPTITGDKKITIRKYRKGAHNFNQGEIIQGIFKDGLNILLQITANTEIKSVNELTDKEAQEDGFESAESAFQELKKYYPDLTKLDDIAIIRYEILKISDTPIISINEFAPSLNLNDL